MSAGSKFCWCKSHCKPLADKSIVVVTSHMYGQDTEVVGRLNIENLDKSLTDIHDGTWIKPEVVRAVTAPRGYKC